MKTVFQKIASPLLALLVLFSTMSFTVDMHYCGGQLVDKAVFSEVKTCGMEMPPSKRSTGESVEENGCCKDISVTVEGQEELKISFEKHELPAVDFLAAFSYSYVSVFEPLSEKHIPFDMYSPPRLIQDLCTLHETYLI